MSSFDPISSGHRRPQQDANARLHWCLVVTVALLAAPVAYPAGAVINSTWVGAIDDDWSNAGNWSPGSFHPNNGQGGNFFNVTAHGFLRLTEDIIINHLQWNGGGLEGFVLSAQTGGTISQSLVLNLCQVRLLGDSQWGNGVSLSLGNGSLFENFGTLTLTGTGSYIGDETSLLHNPAAGALIVDGTGETDFSGSFNNDGSVQVKSGTLTLGGQGIHQGSFSVSDDAVLHFPGRGVHEIDGTLNTSAAGIVRISRPSEFGGGRVVTGPNAFLAIGGTLEVTTFGILELGSGGGVHDLVLDGLIGATEGLAYPAVLTVGNHFTWGTGTIGAGAWVKVDAAATMTTLAGEKSVAGTLVLQGNQTWDNGDFHLISDTFPGPSDGASIENEGTLEILGSRSLTGSGSASYLVNSGTIRIDPGLGTAQLGGAEFADSHRFNNFGTVQVLSGTARLGAGEQSGAFEVTAGAQAVFSAANGIGSFSTVRFNPGASLQIPAGASLKFAMGSLFDTQGSLTVDGDVGVSHGGIRLKSGALHLASLTADTGSLLHIEPGTALTVSGKALVSDSRIYGGGHLGGSFLVGGTSLIAPGGQSLLLPSRSADTLTFEGSLGLGPGTEMRFDLGGTAPGTGHDVVAVTGTLNLGGSTLGLRFISGFESQVTTVNSFTILTADSISGGFANVGDGQRLSTSDGFGSFVVDLDADRVVLRDFQAVPEPPRVALCVAAGLAIHAVRARIRRLRQHGCIGA